MTTPNHGLTSYGHRPRPSTQEARRHHQYHRRRPFSPSYRSCVLAKPPPQPNPHPTHTPPQVHWHYPRDLKHYDPSERRLVPSTNAPNVLPENCSYWEDRMMADMPFGMAIRRVRPMNCQQCCLRGVCGSPLALTLPPPPASLTFLPPHTSAATHLCRHTPLPPPLGRDTFYLGHFRRRAPPRQGNYARRDSDQDTPIMWKPEPDWGYQHATPGTCALVVDLCRRLANFTNTPLNLVSGRRVFPLQSRALCEPSRPPPPPHTRYSQPCQLSQLKPCHAPPPPHTPSVSPHTY